MSTTALLAKEPRAVTPLHRIPRRKHTMSDAPPIFRSGSPFASVGHDHHGSVSLAKHRRTTSRDAVYQFSVHPGSRSSFGAASRSAATSRALFRKSVSSMTPVVLAASEDLVRTPLTLAERRALLLADHNRYPPVLHLERECSVYANTQLRCLVSPCAKCRSAAWSLIRFHVFGDSDGGEPVPRLKAAAAPPSILRRMSEASSSPGRRVGRALIGSAAYCQPSQRLAPVP